MTPDEEPGAVRPCWPIGLSKCGHSSAMGGASMPILCHPTACKASAGWCSPDDKAAAGEEPDDVMDGTSGRTTKASPVPKAST